MAVAGDDGLELPLPAAAVNEESLFDVTSETLDAGLLFLGLDNAGKTTLLQMLKNDRMVAQEPTLHPQSEEIVIGRIRFKAYDLAGHETGRRLWREYFPIASAVLFMVDASDRTRFPEAAEELAHLLASPALAAVPIAVLGQKIDLACAVSEVELRSALRLSPGNMPERIVEVFMCSVLQKRGYGDAIRWVSEIILESRPQVLANKVVPTADLVGATKCGDDLMV
uniref:Small COPII coat GTPase SAR1 n=1 Tax=Pyrodinium bahamense TaxID=73915 RepID=A0A7S0A9L4_9DINO